VCLLLRGLLSTRALRNVRSLVGSGCVKLHPAAVSLRSHASAAEQHMRSASSSFLPGLAAAFERELLKDQGFVVLRGFLEPSTVQALGEEALFTLQYEADSVTHTGVAGHGGVIACYEALPASTISAADYVTNFRLNPNADSTEVLSVSRRLAALAAEALACCFGYTALTEVFLYNEQFICKPPTQTIYSAFDIHRDRDYDVEDKFASVVGTVAVWAPVSGTVSRLNGALCMVPRTHEAAFLAFLERLGGSASRPSAFVTEALCKALMTSAEAPVAASQASLLMLSPGDVVVFADDVWHWSLPYRLESGGQVPECPQAPRASVLQSRVAWMAQYSGDVIRSRRRGGSPAALAVRLPLGCGESPLPGRNEDGSSQHHCTNVQT
jgi:hypothetical protein